MHLLRDMICGVALRKKIAMLLKSNLQLHSPCTEPSEGVHNWRNVKSE